MNIIGYLHGRDPAACLLRDGEIVAFIEEERLLRQKHAANIFPIRSMEACLQQGGLRLSDIDCFAYGYDGPRFANGEIAKFYEDVNRRYPPDPATRSWQLGNLGRTAAPALTARLHYELRRQFGPHHSPPLKFFPHHKSHAVATFHLSPFKEALVLTLDGSGDHQCTTIWRGSGDDLTLLWEAEIPQSLGWFYSAMTEYLGFESYDGEYKVMGLAAYGRPHGGFRAAMDKVLKPGPAGFDYELDRDLIHNGPHSYSSRFTDKLVDVVGMPVRAYREELTPLHEDFAFEAQDALERTVFRLLDHFRNETGLRNLVIGGGVAQNVKMNGRIYQSGMFDDMFLFPIPSDSGTAVGAALGIYYQETRRSRSKVLDNVYWGPSYSDEVIEAELRSCGLVYTRPNDLEGEVAELLATGHIVGWVQGGMEGGARALGARSILADPRTVEARDRVNHAIKFREYWRPFCPSMTAEAAQRFMVKSTNAPFMILTFKATEEAATMIPAVVHIDGTSRIQTVDPDTNPRFYRLLKAFEARTGVAVVLNTSFNIKGEPIVCTPKDALRTFWSTGLDALAIGSFLLVKPSKTAQEAG